MNIEIVNRGLFKQVRITHRNAVINLGMVEADEQPALAEAFYDAWVAMKGKGMEQGEKF